MMTKNEKIRTVLFVIAGLLLGIIVGVLVNDTKIDNEDARGTISRINNYRNVKISEEDLKLRNEILSDTNLYNGYKNYFNFHYITASTMTSALETAIKASEGLSDFKSMNGELIEGLKSYYSNIGHLRSEIMIAIAVLNSLDVADPSDVYMAIANANSSISQMNYKDNSVISFLDEAERYLSTKNGSNVKMLNKAYSHLLMVQGVKAGVVKDKPKMKYLSEKQLTASADELRAYDKDELSVCIQLDISELKNMPIESYETLEACFNDVNLDYVQSILTISNAIIYTAVSDIDILLQGAQMDFSNLNFDQIDILSVVEIDF